MSWIVPQTTRPEAPPPADERTSLEAWLDFHRRTLLRKCAGLDALQLRQRAVPPSTLSLLGLVRHLADVERTWFRQRLDAQDVPDLFVVDEDPDADLHDVDHADPATAFDVLAAEVEAARDAAARHGLDDSFVHPRTGTRLTLRWVYLHMIEEYARHNGHADLLRERIDGVTGD